MKHESELSLSVSVSAAPLSTRAAHLFIYSLMASLCCSAAATLPRCSATATSTCTIARAAPPPRIPSRGATSASGFLRTGQRSANRAAVSFSVRARDRAEGQEEDDESLIDALLSSLKVLFFLKNDSNYLLKAAAGSVGGATAIKYGSVLFPDVTRPNIVQGGVINTYLFFYFFSSEKNLAWLNSLIHHAFRPKEAAQKIPNMEQATKAKSESNLDPETLFSVFDRDGDGYITSKELEESFNKLGLFANTKEVLSEIHKVDMNNDGLIDLEEFRKLYHLVLGDGCHDTREILIDEEYTEEDDDDDDDEERELKGAFSIFDKNGDGMISAEELQAILTALGLKKGERIEDCTDMINKVDMNGDGMVNFEEFKRMMAFKGGKNDSSNVTGSFLTS